MVMVLAGNGSITGVTSMPTPLTLGTITANNGITFPSTQISSGDANTLDDYEEGSFTAYFAGNITGSAMFTGTNPYGHGQAGTNGKYTKIGKRVYFNFYISMASSFSYAGSFGSGTQLWIAGLPFTEGGSASSGWAVYPACVCGYNVASSWAAGYTPMGIIEPGYSTIRICFQTTNTMSNAAGSNFAVGGAGMIWSGHYEAAT